MARSLLQTTEGTGVPAPGIVDLDRPLSLRRQQLTACEAEWPISSLRRPCSQRPLYALRAAAACGAGGVGAVLQMPRGNLEGVSPRALVVPAVALALAQGRYKAAWRLATMQRVDLNLLVRACLHARASVCMHAVRTLSLTWTWRHCAA